jgi:hypothetical protein
LRPYVCLSFSIANEEGTRNHDQPHLVWLDHYTKRRSLRKAPQDRDFSGHRCEENPRLPADRAGAAAGRGRGRVRDHHAVVPPAARALLKGFNDIAEHYEVREAVEA